MTASKKVDEKIREVKTINELLDQIKTWSGDFIYRGQANADWKLKSGAIRRLEAEWKEYPELSVVMDYIRELIDNAKSLGLEFHGRLEGKSCDLKILAELQHNGAATKLLDFSKNILIALWMACSDEAEADGKIFAVNLLEEPIETISEKELLLDMEKLLAENKIWYWVPDRFVSRIQSQASAFLIASDERMIPVKEIVIKKDCKKQILMDLANLFALTETQVYPDLSGFARANGVGKPLLIRDANYYANWADKYMNQKKYVKAISYYDKAISIDKGSYLLYLKKAHAFFKDNQLQDAIKACSVAIKKNPSYARLYFCRGALYGEQKKYRLALSDYDEAVKLNLLDPDLFNNRGLVYQALGMSKLALADYNKSIDLDPSKDFPYYNRGILLYMQKKFDKALADFKTSIKNSSSPQDQYRKIVNFLKIQGNFDQAIYSCKEFRSFISDSSEGKALLESLKKGRETKQEKIME